MELSLQVMTEREPQVSVEYVTEMIRERDGWLLDIRYHPDTSTCVGFELPQSQLRSFAQAMPTQGFKMTPRSLEEIDACLANEVEAVQGSVRISRVRP